jgi:putative ABC transport system permease protein
LNSLALFVGGVMALGAVFAAVNTMNSAVSDRAREIATLRAIGFGPMAVLSSVIVESMGFALLGALLGGGAAWLLFNGHAVNTLGANFAQVVFHLTVSGPVFGAGVLAACAIGAIGGLIPASRAIRMSIAAAFRAS